MRHFLSPPPGVCRCLTLKHSNTGSLKIFPLLSCPDRPALLSPSHLHNSHITSRLTLIYTSPPLTLTHLQQDLFSSFSFNFTAHHTSPIAVGNWYSSNSTPTSFLCLSLCAILFLRFSHFHRRPGFRVRTRCYWKIRFCMAENRLYYAEGQSEK